MTKALIEVATKKSCDILDLETLQRRLQDLLQGKRFLLVSDDVWDDKQDNWQNLRSVLSCGGKGASILVTTRLTKVAEIMRTTPPHDISKLSEEDCWELFKQNAFGPNEVEREELVVIGKEILRMCGGVPLAATALGILLRFKREEKEWHYVKESKLWNLQDEDNVMPALRLSYLNLLVKLRQCFALCALFPKDKIISKRFLIELLISNGFISSNKMLNEEDIGNEVWNELYWRSFFQDIETDVFGQITSFKMHDLVHDLAQSISEEVCCITVKNDLPSTLERIRHLSIDGTVFEKQIDSGISSSVDSILMHNFKSLRTYIIRSFDYSGRSQGFPLNISKFCSLRVLRVRCQLKKVPSSIGHLKYLRYLDLTWGEFETLPDSICKLWNLQILKLDYCMHLQKLPNNLIHLKALQHLSLNHCYCLSSLPPQIGKMTLLKTLSMYVVGKGNLLADLGQLNFTVDCLRIKHLERVNSVEDAKEANMLTKHVNTLWLSWDEKSQLQENIEQILEVLQPYTQQLQELRVGGYTGSHLPQWIFSPYLEALYVYDLPNLTRLSREDSENMFPHLSKLYIGECPNLLGLPCLPSLKYMNIGGKCNHDLLSSIHKLGTLESLVFCDIQELKCFPDEILRNLTSLKELTVFGCSEIEGLGEALQHVTSLQSLELNNLSNLTSLPDSLGNLSSLKKLEIWDCPKLIRLPASIQSLSALKILSIYDCPELEKRCKRETGEDWPKISHIQDLNGDCFD